MKLSDRRRYRAETGEYFGTPKEIWGFLTPPSRRSAVAVARRFLADNHDLLGLTPRLGELGRHPVVIDGVAASHVVFRQELGGNGERIPVFRAWVTVHVNHRGQVYMCKCRAVPRDMVAADGLERRFSLNERAARRAAREFLISPALRPPAALTRGRRLYSRVHEVRQCWFNDHGDLLPCWKVRISRYRPKQEWTLMIRADVDPPELLDHVDDLAENGGISGVALVFDPNPVTACGGHADLLDDDGYMYEPPWSAYRLAELKGLKGNGYLEGDRVRIAVPRRARRLKRRNHQYFIRAWQRGFEEVMTYHHIDTAIRYLERLGYNGKRRLFRESSVETDSAGRTRRVYRPVVLTANVYHTDEDAAWYSPRTRQIYFGTGEVSECEDAETILHEFGHSIQDFIVPNFGSSNEAAAIGEGFADYFACSFFAAVKPEIFRPTVMSWDGVLIGMDRGHAPPCLRRLDMPLTYEDFDHGSEDEDPSPHDNGQIWSATLWDIFCAIGKDAADRIIIESHFELDPKTEFYRAARAIIHADRNLFGGSHERSLRKIFKRRGIDPWSSR